MATTTAQITITSTDISDNAISLSNTATLTKAGSTTGLDQTSGISRRTLASTSTVKLIDLDHYQGQTLTANKAAKVYIKNTGTSTAQCVKVGIQNAAGSLEEIGPFDFIVSNSELKRYLLSPPVNDSNSKSSGVDHPRKEVCPPK